LLTQVGETAINPIHKSTCHCGSVELELQLPDGIVDPRRCNCSICRRKGAVVGSVPLSGLKIVKGEDKLSLYQFETKEAEHYFWHLHTPQTEIESKSVWHQPGMSGRR
jgi:hypothetical protein